MKEDRKFTFEEAMHELEKIVERLEEGEVPLEEAISIYKKGMELSKFCHDQLKQAEEQMVNIMTEEGELKPFTVEEENR
ncbi:MAG TPA: exodeoxyribonuclease VII small subunit [Bacillus sp. (in: firmicutes)]|uniref:exodeoxyribonuclease VII small subunit n=1 Tax=Bacillus litorisediminis TaxID=2922713 RepID=UPI001FAF31E2|nr:exodeoxyribonuclease VII small subunit [Bacillus litorisediminis]HWO76221.1 exodeoxyribonuclease VII small subunit [Bacillus sp. (in: firmicutes)]